MKKSKLLHKFDNLTEFNQHSRPNAENKRGTKKNKNESLSSKLCFCGRKIPEQTNHRFIELKACGSFKSKPGLR